MRDDSASLYCAIGITLPLATFALVARLYARRITKAGFWYDDTLAILGFVCGSSFSKPNRVLTRTLDGHNGLYHCGLSLYDRPRLISPRELLSNDFYRDRMLRTWDPFVGGPEEPHRRREGGTRLADALVQQHDLYIRNRLLQIFDPDFLLEDLQDIWHSSPDSGSVRTYSCLVPSANIHGYFAMHTHHGSLG